LLITSLELTSYVLDFIQVSWIKIDNSTSRVTMNIVYY
jgi:hypothetical protein